MQSPRGARSFGQAAGHTRGAGLCRFAAPPRGREQPPGADGPAFPGDEGFLAIVDELPARSELFARLWARGDVRPAGTRPKEMEHPLVGELHFESTQLRVPNRNDLTIVLHNASPGTDTPAKLEWLASAEGRRSTIHPLAG